MKGTKNIQSKSQNNIIIIDKINDLLDAFKLGYISLDEMWYQLDDFIDTALDAKVVIKSNIDNQFNSDEICSL